uniref:Uncharacterized protein MANES_01G027700 n=1 Tax=Rhizophora mucronata TaxID=61149 RepID=A0A2P2KFE2_RHIMU
MCGNFTFFKLQEVVCRCKMCSILETCSGKRTGTKFSYWIKIKINERADSKADWDRQSPLPLQYIQPLFCRRMKHSYFSSVYIKYVFVLHKNEPHMYDRDAAKANFNEYLTFHFYG